MFEGVLPAIITPFNKDNDLDEEGLRRNIEYLEAGGVSGVVPCGTTGESATLTTEEHNRVIEIVVECAKVPVVAGTGSNSTSEAVALTKHAEDTGADAALLITPYYNKPNEDGLFEHFKLVAKSCDIPLILYNVPSRTGLNMRPELVARLAAIEGIAGIKEASGSIAQVSRLIELTRDEDFKVISGDDALTFPMIALGASAVISVVANVAPRKTVEMVEAALRGDLVKARRLHFELAPLMSAMFLETNPIPVKTACGMMGLAAGPLRLPLAPLSKENIRTLKSVLDRLGEFG